MRVVLYTHSLVSDWNHGNAHFQRGVLRELEARGHHTLALEPENGWSRMSLVKDQGPGAIDAFHRTFPELNVATYTAGTDHAAILSDADLVIVHEWTDPGLVAEIGRMRAKGARFTLLFHDTHHRAVSDSDQLARLDLDGYDAVLAFGEVLRELYIERGWGRRVFTWHEAADIRLFHPRPELAREHDLVWIGNWGDDERKDELRAFLMEPVASLGISTSVHGVRYPEHALWALRAAGADYRGWISSAEVPEAYARHRLTVHVPRRPYATTLRGIPTIRMFEALACGIPLISAPWSDCEGLFRAGDDFLFVASGDEMKAAIREVLNDADLADAMARSGRDTILGRHTCGHRVDELIAVLSELDALRLEDA